MLEYLGSILKYIMGKQHCGFIKFNKLTWPRLKLDKNIEKIMEDNWQPRGNFFICKSFGIKCLGQKSSDSLSYYVFEV